MKLFGIVSIAVLVLVSLVGGSVAHAVSHKGLGISPVRTELTIQAGTPATRSLTITNNTSAPMPVTMTAEAFTIANEQYDYVFHPDSQMKDYVTFSSDKLTLAPGQKQKILYTVSIPPSTPRKGVYLSLFANTKQQKNEAIKTHERVGLLLYITLKGTASPQGNVSTLSSPWLLSGATDWTATMRNTGATHFTSRRTVSTQTVFGTTIAAQTSYERLLPGTARFTKGAIPLPQIPGIYKIVYDIELGSSPPATLTRYALYVPPLLTSVLLAGLILIGVIFILRARLKH